MDRFWCENDGNVTSCGRPSPEGRSRNLRHLLANGTWCLSSSWSTGPSGYLRRPDLAIVGGKSSGPHPQDIESAPRPVYPCRPVRTKSRQNEKEFPWEKHFSFVLPGFVLMGFRSDEIRSDGFSFWRNSFWWVFVLTGFVLMGFRSDGIRSNGFSFWRDSFWWVFVLTGFVWWVFVLTRFVLMGFRSDGITKH